MPTQDWMGFRPNGYEGQNSLDEEVFTNNEGGILPPRVFTEADQLLDGPSRFFEVHTLLAALVSKPAYSVIRFAEPEQLRQYIGRTMVWLGNLIMMLTHGLWLYLGKFILIHYFMQLF